MRRIMQIAILILPLSALYIWACDKGKTTDTATQATPTPTTDQPNATVPEIPGVQGQLSISPLNMTVPKDVAMTSPTSSISASSLTALQSAGKLSLATTSLALADGTPVGTPNSPNGTPVGTPNASNSPAAGQATAVVAKDYLSKVKLLQSTMTATTLADCAAAVPTAFSLPQGGLGQGNTCFGSEMTFTSHPNHSPANPNASFGSGDTGISAALAGDEAPGQACSTGVVNKLMDAAGGYSDVALGFQAMLACGGRLASVALPEIGTTQNMLPTIAGISLNNLSISAATLTREADTAEGKPVYATSVSGSITDAARGLTKTFQMSVRHVPQDDTNSTYKGVIQFRVDAFDNINPDKDAVISLAYDWTATGLKYRYRQFMTSSEADAFSATTKEVVAPTSNMSSWQEIRAQTDPYGFGKLAYTWITFDALVFNAETKDDGTGSAYFGHTNYQTTAIDSDDFYKIEGFRCYAKNPPLGGAFITYNPYVQKQTMKMNTTSKQWEHDTSNITFAPTGDCNWSGGGTLVRTRYSPSIPAGVSETLSAPINADLYPLATYQSEWTAPAAPATL